MRRLVAIFGGAVLLLFMCQPVAAAALWTVTPEVWVEQHYTDNLFREREDRSWDWTTVVGTGLELEASGRTEGMTLSYRPSYSMYYRYDEYNTLRHRADLDLWKDLNRNLRFSFLNSFDRREQPFDPGDLEIELDPDYIDAEELRRGREPRTINTARTRLDYDYGPRNTVYAQYALRHEWNDNPGEEDIVRHSPSAGLTHWFNRSYGVEARTQYTHGIYDETEDRDIWDSRARLMRNFTRNVDGYVQYRHSHVRYTGDRPGYTVYEPSAGVSYRFAREGSMSLGLGYYIREEQDEEDSEESLIVNAEIDKTWSQRRSSFTLRGASGYTETMLGDEEEQGFTVYYHGRADYTYALSRNLDWNISAGYRRSIYRDREPERRDNIYHGGSGLGYMLTRNVSLGLDYDHRRVDSNLRTEEYYENRATLSLIWRPQGWRLN